MKTYADRKYLLIINIFMQLVFCFFNLFFNIYAYSLKSDINFVLIYNLCFHLFIFVLTFVFNKIASKRIMSIMYKTSFFIVLLCTGVTFFLNSKNTYLVFVIQFIYALASVCYYIPNEISTMSKNSKSQMKNFLGLQSALSIFSLVLSPFLSGVIIDYISHQILFLIMSICSVICLSFSLNLNIVDEEVKHIPLNEYLKDSHKDKAVRQGYLGYAFSKFALDGPISIILSLVLFFKTGTNFSVGLYSALASFIACIVLILYSYFVKKTILSMWICSIGYCIVSILVLVSGSIVSFFIYYFTKAIVTKLLTVEINSNLFTLVNHTSLKEYKVAQRVTICIYSKSAILLASIICFVLYNINHSIIGLIIFFVVCSFLQLFSTYFVTQSYKSLKNEIEFNEVVKKI